MGNVKTKIQIARKRKGMTQQKMADLLGITLRSYQRYEYGENMPKSNKLKQLANILEISVYDIL